VVAHRATKAGKKVPNKVLDVIRNPRKHLMRGKKTGEVREKVWAQCDSCGKWRNLGSYILPEDLPSIWFFFELFYML